MKFENVEWEDIYDTEWELKKKAEEIDQMVFNFVEPYCSHIVKRDIDKDFLKQALINYNGVVFTGNFKCPSCKEVLHIPLNKIIGRKELFCWNCGMKLRRYWGGKENGN